MKANPMASAALLLGILSIILSSVFFIALPCGAIAIVCAILSRDPRPLSGRGRIGILCGTAGIIISVALTLSSLWYFISTEDGRAVLQYYYQVYTGDTTLDVGETLDELFPFLAGSSEETPETEEIETEEIPTEGSPAEEPDDTDNQDHSGGGESEPSRPSKGGGQFI